MLAKPCPVGLGVGSAKGARHVVLKFPGHRVFPKSVCEGFLLKISCGIRLPIIIISSSSSSHHHHHLIIIIISSSSHHHHLLIIISPSSSSSFLSLSLAFLFFSNLAQPSIHEKRARCNPSQGKCVSSVKN